MALLELFQVVVTEEPQIQILRSPPQVMGVTQEVLEVMEELTVTLLITPEVAVGAGD
jgi:hypothetical protein